jgi:hypothetical protein|tara:strand:+ start:40 stop:645 length:606 start_codon:yes stop_codon:yes gene_type:complete
MSFWTTDFSSDDTTLKDPKRKFRWQVQFTGLSAGTNPTLLWYAKTVTKPSFTIAAAEHKYLNHTFYYPGSVTWNDVAMTLVDPVSPDTTATFSDIMVQSGYAPPSDPSTMTTMSKASAAGALGAINITQYDGAGVALETWTMHNAFLSEVKYGDLAYGEDDLTEVSIVIKYDWASVTTANDGAKSSGKTEFFSLSGDAATA